MIDRGSSVGTAIVQCTSSPWSLKGTFFVVEPGTTLHSDSVTAPESCGIALPASSISRRPYSSRSVSSAIVTGVRASRSKSFAAPNGTTISRTTISVIVIRNRST